MRPICLAVPSIVLIADSRLVVFRSCNFVFAISSIFGFEIVPTFSRFGLPDPFRNSGGFLQQVGRRRRLRFKRETSDPHKP